MAEHSQNNQASEQATTSGEFCQVKVRSGDSCGKSVHRAPPSADDIPSCLMHSNDPNKSGEGFQSEVERILEKAGESKANFFRFVFPSANYQQRIFKAACDFGYAVFAGDANFSDATFEQGADFYEAEFMRGATFLEATFAQAMFNQAKFKQDGDFRSAKFRREAGFVSTLFTTRANFHGAEFAQDADALFRNTNFEQDADFGAVKFWGDVDFRFATFKRRASFTSCHFAGEANFVETKFKPDPAVPCPNLTRATFKTPEQVQFYRTSFRHALFHKCDVSGIEFSNVEWRQRKNGKCMVFEEDIDLLEKEAEALRPVDSDSDERNYRLIAELYQRLKKYYDDRRDYWTAGDFHYGELEMRRLHSPRKNKVLRWLHHNVGLVAWYERASAYGESYVRPFVVLLIVLGVFTLLLPRAGLDRNEDATRSTAQQQAPAALSELSYEHFNDFVGAYSGRCIGRAAFFGNSLMTVLSVAGFQKELKYEPSYPWGRALALLELLLTSTLIALFLLAVRRQFKR